MTEDLSSTQIANKITFEQRSSVYGVEEGDSLQPKFGPDGLITCVTTDYDSGELLMVGYMNEEALRLSIANKQAYYWSRSRETLWHKGKTSGLVQNIVELRIDDDQDAVWLRVKVAGNGASCHVGYRSCFYRAVDIDGFSTTGKIQLKFCEKEKVFKPNDVYGDAPNPTQL